MRSAVASVALAAMLAGCGTSDGAGSSTQASAAAVPASVPASAAASASSAPATTPPVTTAPATTAPATTAPPTTAAPTTTATSAVPPTIGEGLSMACLQGEWLLKPDRTDLFLSTLVPFAPISVPSGSISMTIAGDRVETYWNIVVRFTLPTGSVEAPLDLRQAGNGLIAGRAFLVNVTETQGGWGRFTGTVGGVAVDVPAPPVGDIPGLTGGPAQCAGNELSMLYSSGATDAIAYFERVR